MESDPTLRKILEQAEGRRNDVYRDSEGFWTIGIGHLVSRDKTLVEHEARALCGGPWSESQVDAQLDADIEGKVKQLKMVFPWFEELPEWPRRGVISMAFQMGIGGVQGFPRMLTALMAGHWANAEQNALDSWGTEDRPGWHKQTPARCEQTSQMLGNRAIA